jgi:hypothetical protein
MKFEVPLNIGTRLLKALLVAYASELWGCSEKRAMPSKKVLSEAVRSLIRLRPRSTVTSSSTLALAFGIPFIHAVASSARVRVYCKFPSLRTTIAKLVCLPCQSVINTREKNSPEADNDIIVMDKIDICDVLPE